MSIPATQLRPGMIIKHNNDLHSVFSVEHRTPGNLRAFIQAKDYLTSNLQIKVEFFDGKAVGIELPQTVVLTVTEVEPGLKSATASSVTKPAKTETGLIVQVPPFINEGEKIKVDTAEGTYLSRAQ